MSERYILNTGDKALLSAATDLLNKVAADETTKPAQLVTVARLLHVLSVLPRVTPDVTASVSVSCPRHKFAEIETFHWWDFGIEDGSLLISSGGHFNDPKTGGDTFTTMDWGAVPEEPAELNDYRESLWMVPDVRSFPEGVKSIDLAAGGYTTHILDDDNPLLDGNDDDDEDEDIEGEDNADVDADAHAHEVPEKNEYVSEHTPRSWSITPVSRSEERLAALVDSNQVDAKEPAYHYGIENCDQCGCALDQLGLHVDGCLRGDMMWSNMCADCFEGVGEGIGWGKGQLYARQPDGQWRLVAGWEPEDKSEAMDGTEFGPTYDLFDDLAATPNPRHIEQKGPMQAEVKLATQTSPEQQELAATRRELVLLLSELADRELSLADLKSSLANFEGRYLREVGVLYAELDEWNAKIAELIAEADGTIEAQSVAAEARKQADETHAAAYGEASKVDTPESSPELKKLRNEVLLAVHPDLTVDESDRILRTRLTQEAMDAYSRRDMDALQKILAEYKSSPESVKGIGVTADLKRVILQIQQISRRFAEIEVEVAALTSSEIALLMAKVGVATAKGRNLLAEMAADVRARVNLSRQQFEDQLAKSKQS